MEGLAFADCGHQDVEPGMIRSSMSSIPDGEWERIFGTPNVGTYSFGKILIVEDDSYPCFRNPTFSVVPYKRVKDVGIFKKPGINFL